MGGGRERGCAGRAAGLGCRAVARGRGVAVWGRLRAPTLDEEDEARRGERRHVVLPEGAAAHVVGLLGAAQGVARHDRIEGDALAAAAAAERGRRQQGRGACETGRGAVSGGVRASGQEGRVGGQNHLEQLGDDEARRIVEVGIEDLVLLVARPALEEVRRRLELGVDGPVGVVARRETADDVDQPVGGVLLVGEAEAQRGEVLLDELAAAAVDLLAALAEQQQVRELLVDGEARLVDDADDREARQAQLAEAARQLDGRGAVEARGRLRTAAGEVASERARDGGG